MKQAKVYFRKRFAGILRKMLMDTRLRMTGNILKVMMLCRSV